MIVKVCLSFALIASGLTSTLCRYVPETVVGLVLRCPEMNPSKMFLLVTSFSAWTETQRLTIGLITDSSVHI